MQLCFLGELLFEMLAVTVAALEVVGVPLEGHSGLE